MDTFCLIVTLTALLSFGPVGFAVAYKSHQAGLKNACLASAIGAIANVCVITIRFGYASVGLLIWMGVVPLVVGCLSGAFGARVARSRRKRRDPASATAVSDHRAAARAKRQQILAASLGLVILSLVLWDISGPPEIIILCMLAAVVGFFWWLGLLIHGGLARR